MDTDGSGSSVEDGSSRDDSNLSTVDSSEHLEDGFELGVGEGVLARVGVGVESVDGGLLTGHQRGSRVGGIGDETAHR